MPTQGPPSSMSESRSDSVRDVERSTSGRIRALIVDDHLLIAQGLRMLLDSTGRIDVIAEAHVVADALELAAACQPDVVLLDLDLGGDDGLRLIPEVRKAAPSTQVIVVTGTRDPRVHEEALRSGARGIVVKDKAADVLVKAIEKVQEGELWFERTLLSRALDRATNGAGAPRVDGMAGRIASLTAREREVISLIGAGLRNQEIAGKLFIAEKTVRNHVTGIFAKLSVSDRLELALFAYRHGLADIPR